MMRKCALLFLFFVASTTAFAQQGGIAAADTNKDNKIDAAELKTYVSGKLADFTRFDELMKELDKEKDGSIDSQEFEGRMDAIRSMMQRPEPKKEPAKPVEFAERYEQRFAKKKPLLRDTISGDLSAFDGDGKELSFKAIRGKYTVIVFGCLT